MTSVTNDPTCYNFPQFVALGPDKIDNLGRALLSLTRELCVMTDRQVVLERLLEDAGVVTSDAIEHFEPDETAQGQINTRMAAIVRSVFDEFVGD